MVALRPANTSAVSRYLLCCMYRMGNVSGVDLLVRVTLAGVHLYIIPLIVIQTSLLKYQFMKPKLHPSLFSVAVINTITKSNLGRKGFNLAYNP